MAGILESARRKDEGELCKNKDEDVVSSNEEDSLWLLNAFEYVRRIPMDVVMLGVVPFRFGASLQAGRKLNIIAIRLWNTFKVHQ